MEGAYTYLWYGGTWSYKLFACRGGDLPDLV